MKKSKNSAKFSSKSSRKNCIFHSADEISFFILQNFDAAFLLKNCDWSGAKECESCRSRKMLKNAPTLAIVAVHTEENEPPKVWKPKISFISFGSLEIASLPRTPLLKSKHAQILTLWRIFPLRTTEKSPNFKSEPQLATGLGDGGRCRSRRPALPRGRSVGSRG